MRDSSNFVSKTTGTMASRDRTTLRVSLMIICLAALSGCAGSLSTGEYQTPTVPEKPDWSESLGEEHQIEESWWRGFGDPQLDELVATSVANNIDLQAIAARSELAKAQIGQAKAALLPVFNAGVRSDTTTISGEYDLGTSRKSGVGGEMLWELDVWGKARKGVQAQQAGYRASEAEYRAAYLTLISSVAETYFLIRQTDAQIAQQRLTLSQSLDVQTIYRDMQVHGLADEQTVARQQAQVAAARITLQVLETNRLRLENGLATLIGTPAGTYELPDTATLPLISPVQVPAGLPSELLTRRPDILAAEERLKQTVALESQARLAQLPTVGLTSIGGSASYGLSSLLETWTMGLSGVVQFPVFDPNVRARIPVSEAQVEVAEQEYRAMVMRAFEEVENALITLDGARSQQTLLLEMRDKLAFSAEQEFEKLKLGLSSQLDILEAQRSLQEAEQKLLANQWQILSDTVSLFKAVGGGWTPGETDS